MKPLLTHPRGTPGRTAALYRIVRAVLRGIARSVYHLRVEGTENIPPRGGVILAANHVSALDPFVIGVAVRRRVHYMAKEELFRSRALAYLLTQLQAFPVRRGKMDPSTMKFALSLLHAGEVLLMFPEGRRGDGVHLGAAQRGGGILAERTGVPVVPVYHQGTGEVLPRGAWRPRWAPLTVLFGPPLRSSDQDGGPQGVEELSRRVMEAIAALREKGMRGQDARCHEGRDTMNVTESLQRRRTLV